MIPAETPAVPGATSSPARPSSVQWRWQWQRIAKRARVPLGFVFAAVYLWLAKPAWATLAGGSAIVICGLALRAAASGHVRKNEELTVTGPYQYTRHPLYLGSLIMALGFALAARSFWILGAIVLLFVAVYWPVMIAEENFLRAQFPSFVQYERDVPRLLPRLLPRLVSRWRTTVGGGAFSRELYRQHREYRAALGALLLLAALAGKMLWQGAH